MFVQSRLPRPGRPVTFDFMEDTQSTQRDGTLKIHELEEVVIRFAGDSGDGVQITGAQFTSTTALAGNDLATLPDYPAEIRAPAGTLPGVSGFQIQFSSRDVFTPGDSPDVLVAMNPAALRVNLSDLKPGGILVVNRNSFEKKDLEKAGFAANPLEDGSLEGYRLFEVELSRLTKKAVEPAGLDTRSSERCKNFFALGMMYWLFQRPLDPTESWLASKFASDPKLLEGNLLALRGGYTYAEATEVFNEAYRVAPASVPPGRYRNITGNSALALGLMAAAHRSGLRLFFGSYPITPASEILHELSHHKNHGVITFQAEDEIAAAGAALGASFAGALGCTASSGPGIALKSETIGLAVMAELPLVICDVQRAGPSTGMPTKTEQADLFLALFGRPSEAPVPVLAPATPAECFAMAYEAARLAVEYMTPVILLSDGYLGNGTEPWLIPDLESLPGFGARGVAPDGPFEPYGRDPATLSRPWVAPGTPGREHRIGGLEKAERSGAVSYDPANHEQMVRVRAEKIQRIAQAYPPGEVLGEPADRILIVGWGSTYGAIAGAIRHARADGIGVSHLHLRRLWPLPSDLADILRRFDHVIVPELNLGQLAFLLRAQYLVPVRSLAKVQGKPFVEREILREIAKVREEAAVRGASRKTGGPGGSEGFGEGENGRHGARN